MKNPLELQIVQKISKANKLVRNGQLHESVNDYNLCLETFYLNRSYNQSISPHYQSTILSSKGMVLIKLCSFQQAEQCLDRSLFISPNNCISFIRRANLYMNTNRLSHAIEDLGKACLQFPESSEIMTLKSDAKKQIQKIMDKSERQRLNNFFLEIFHKEESVTASDQITLDQENMFSFSNLREIDKLSAKQEYKRKINKKCSLYISPRPNQLEAGRPRKYSSQAAQVQSQDSYQPVVISKKRKSKKSEFSRPSSIDSIEGNDSVKNSGKSLKSRTSSPQIKKRMSQVKFQDLEYVKNVNQISTKQSVKKQKKKSCLRTSKIIFAQNKQNNYKKGRTSSFLNLKTIDRLFQTDESCQVSKQQSRNSLYNAPESCQADNKSDSDKEDDGEHNIYGSKYNTLTALKCVDNLSKLMNYGLSHKEAKNGKKQSILKKGSEIGSMRQSKKSVCFSIK